jgi:SAM-dependent methyltransferase
MKRVINKLFNCFGLEIQRKHRFAHVFENKPINAQDDDFNWETYNDHYRQELRDIQETHTLKLNPGEYSFENDKLVKIKDVLPLHPNHRLLYETIFLLKPLKVIEIGCGGGDHLFNLNLLIPKIEIAGYDRSTEQLNLVLERSPNLKGKILELDITMPFSSKLPLVDLVYTQAVIMHIKTGNGHLVALSNLFKLASKQVVLMENWTSHPFLDDVKFLFEQGMLPWKQLYFYFRRAPELQNKPHLMVASSEPLFFEPLNSYSQLVDSM